LVVYLADSAKHDPASSRKLSANMLPELPELLTLAGFTLRGKNRATCAWCSGHDKITASYTNLYVHCFRCNQTKGYTTLARELGLLDKVISDADRAKLEEIRKKEKRHAEFLAWQKSKLNNIIARFRTLNFRARLAHEVLKFWPEEEHAWATLAETYHKEALLNRAFDFFSMTAVSNWLEEDSTPEEIVALFNEQTRGNR
jgi:exonuclease I